jgi:hypothetical protein
MSHLQRARDWQGRRTPGAVVPVHPPPPPPPPPGRGLPAGVAAEIQRIEAEALALGWPRELLWNSRFWNFGPHGNQPGLAAVLGTGCSIVEARAEAMVIAVGPRGDRQVFRRHVAVHRLTT